MFDFLRKFWKTKENNTAIEMPDDHPLDFLWTKFGEEKYDEVIIEAKKILAKNETIDHNGALKLLGLSYFRQKQFNLSEEIFRKLAENSTNSDDWFNLLTSCTLNKQIEHSELVLEKTIALYNDYGTKDSLSIPRIFYYYMHALRDVQEYAKAFKQLERLGSIYTSLVITDSTFLYIRGVPFFSDSIEAGKEILEHIDKDVAKHFIDELVKHVDEEGKEYLYEFEKTIHYRN
jgi:tetratricopeptide (TPR) repeat protein